MNTDVSITLIVPVYNVEKYLTQCLDSVVGQSVSFDEVIIINDGSTDRSRSICEKYILNYGYFKLINQENRGLSVARNVGLDHAVSEYILFLDSDDYLREDTVKRLKSELRRSRQDAVYFEADIHCEKGYEVRKNQYVRNLKDFAGTQMSGEMFFEKCYPENYIVSAGLAVYRKKVIERSGIRFPEGLYYEDYYFTYTFMMHAENVTCISEKLYVRRYRENSIITSKYTERKFIDQIKIISLVCEEVVKQKDLALPENQIYLKFINNYCGIVLERRRLCKKNNITLSNNSQNSFCAVVKKYGIFLDQYCLNDCMDWYLLNGILKNIKKIMLYCPEYNASTELLLKKMRSVRSRFETDEKIKQTYIKRLRGLLLDEKERKVGIYGTGEHTEGLLAIYEELIGKIACKLFFIDSCKESGSYLGRNIINYRLIDNSFDQIIISSFLYEKEMIENVRSINKEVPIYFFYDAWKEDAFSGWDIWVENVKA